MDESIRVELGPDNLPESARIPGAGALSFQYTATQLTLVFVGDDGTTESYTVELTAAPVAALVPRGSFVSAVPGVAPAGRLGAGDDEPRYPSATDSNIIITRGVRLDVLLDGLGELPPGLAPFVRTTDCVVPPNVSCSFWSAQNGSFWSMGITHSAFAIAGPDQIPEPDWPDVERCEQARGSLKPWFGGLVASTIAPSTVAGVAQWLGVLTAGAATAPAAIAAGTVGAVVYSLTATLTEFLRGEIDCSAVIRRTSVATFFASGLQSTSFTVEVCFPDHPSVLFESRCQSVGPYRPFANDVELGTLTFHATQVTAPPEITALTATGGGINEPIGVAAVVRGGTPPYTFTWNAPGAVNVSGDFVEADGTAGFTFPQAGTYPVTVTVRDAEGRTITAQTSVAVTGLTDVTARGAVSASTSFSTEYWPHLAVDGSRATSWFSAGPQREGSEVSTFTWDAGEDYHIGRISIYGNGNHATPDFRTGFGFDVVTVQILDANRSVVWEEVVGLGGTPDPDVVLTPDVVGHHVILVFGGHEAPDCGGFSELVIEAWTDGS
jgi:hypothetical protein